MSSQQNLQGGKAFGELKAQQEKVLDSLNKEFLDDPKYSTDEDLPEKLEAFKKKYMEFDLNGNGDIDIMALKRMLEKLGGGQDPPGAEENDHGGDGRPGRDHRVPGLRPHDAGQALGHLQTDPDVRRQSQGERGEAGRTPRQEGHR
ncbi:unnamed protein product [Eretmochelys imbricata]